MSQLARVRFLILVCIAGASLASAETTTYHYDALGRLVQVQVSGGVMNGVQQTYQYDATGNRSELQATGATSPRPTMIVPAKTTLNVIGSNVELTVNVGDSTAGGSVSFTFNEVFVGSAPVINGVAHVGLEGVTPNDYTVRAIYTGDSSNEPVTSTFNVKVQDLSWLPIIIDLILSN